MRKSLIVTFGVIGLCAIGTVVFAQRQQTKWFVYALVVFFLFLGINDVPGTLVPGLSAPDSWYQLLSALMWLSIWTVLLLGVSIPILRYRLWDVDLPEDVERMKREGLAALMG